MNPQKENQPPRRRGQVSLIPNYLDIMLQSNQDIRTQPGYSPSRSQSSPPKSNSNEVKLPQKRTEEYRARSEFRKPPSKPARIETTTRTVRGYNPGQHSYLSDRFSRNQDCREQRTSNPQSREIPYKYPPVHEQSRKSRFTENPKPKIPKESSSKPGITVKGISSFQLLFSQLEFPYRTDFRLRTCFTNSSWYSTRK